MSLNRVWTQSDRRWISNPIFWTYGHTSVVFRARWLASTEVISQVLFTSEQPKKKQNGFFWYIITNKVTLWFASYSACVVYTKTIIHLSFGESGGYLPGRLAAPLIHHYSPPLRWRIVNYAPTYEAEEEDKSTWYEPGMSNYNYVSKVPEHRRLESKGWSWQ